MVRQGDVIKISFEPQKGHEQAGWRPAIVVSNKLLNNKTTLAFMCPVTHTNRKNPFHYQLNGYDFVDGYVMCDQMKTMDLSSRKHNYLGTLNKSDLFEILDRIQMLIEMEL